MTGFHLTSRPLQVLRPGGFVDNVIGTPVIVDGWLLGVVWSDPERGLEAAAGMSVLSGLLVEGALAIRVASWEDAVERLTRTRRELLHLMGGSVCPCGSLRGEHQCVGRVSDSSKGYFTACLGYMPAFAMNGWLRVFNGHGSC